MQHDDTYDTYTCSIICIVIQNIHMYHMYTVHIIYICNCTGPGQTMPCPAIPRSFRQDQRQRSQSFIRDHRKDPKFGTKVQNSSSSVQSPFGDVTARVSNMIKVAHLSRHGGKTPPTQLVKNLAATYDHPRCATKTRSARNLFSNRRLPAAC